jgi:hypothetical protein
MSTKIGSRALIPNPALEPLGFLVGEWKTSGTHPLVPDTILYETVRCEWIEGGAFLMMHSQVEHELFPQGVAIFGSDDLEKKFFLLYFDERGVSRKYDVSIEGRELKWWRDDPTFSQRMSVAVAEDQNKMVSSGEMCREGGEWEKDLSQTFERVQTPT